MRRAGLCLLLLLVLPAARPAAAQVVHGRVAVAVTDSGLAGATVRMVRERSRRDTLRDSVRVRADSAGAFALEAPRPGRYRLTADAPGFRAATSRPLGLDDDDTLQVVLRLSADTVLVEPLEVVGATRELTLAAQQFYARARAAGRQGTFITRDDIERRHPVFTTDLLFRAPSLRRVPNRRGGGYAVRGRGNCVPQVFIDGTRVTGGAASIDEWVRPQEVEGIEVYAGFATAPVEYAGRGADCAVILIWTRLE